LLSAVFGAAAVGLTCLAALELTASRLASLAAAALIGLAPLEWTWSTIAGVRSLAVLFVAAALWLALRWRRTRSTRDLFALALVCGLALAHHRTFLLLLPFLALYVLMVDARRVLKVGLLARAIVLFLVPLLLYFVLWLRAAQGVVWDQYGAGT